MGKIAEKIKYFLDWMQHGYLIVQVLSSIGLGTVLKAILVRYTHMPTVWITPFWLLTSALIMALLVFMGNQLRKRQGQDGGLTQTERAVSLVTSTTKFDATVFFLAKLKLQVTMLEKRATSQDITYVAKLRVVITNEGEETHLEPLSWTTGIGNISVQTGRAPYEGVTHVPALAGLGYRYQLEKYIGGWKNDEWMRLPNGEHEEHTELDIRPGWTFRVWIGLDPLVPHDVLEKLRKQRRLGKLNIPVMLGNKTEIWREDV